MRKVTETINGKLPVYVFIVTHRSTLIKVISRCNALETTIPVTSQGFKKNKAEEGKHR